MYLLIQYKIIKYFVDINEQQELVYQYLKNIVNYISDMSVFHKIYLNKKNCIIGFYIIFISFHFISFKYIIGLNFSENSKNLCAITD